MFLKYSEMWDMDLGGEPSTNEIPHWFGNAAYVVVGGLCKLLFPVSYTHLTLPTILRV